MKNSTLLLVFLVFTVGVQYMVQNDGYFNYMLDNLGVIAVIFCAHVICKAIEEKGGK